MKKTVAFGFLGTTLDYAGKGSQRWEKWRPTVALCQQPDLVIDRLELLHDAEEGFLGFDCISPLKAVLGEPFRAVAERLMQAVAQRYRLQPWTPDGHRQHKQADLAAAASEAVHCVGWTHAEVRNIWRIDAPIIDTDPLAAVYGEVPWKPWPLEVAAQRFHDTLQALCARRDLLAAPRP